MNEVLSIENLANLGVLIFLQVVLGFDNLLYISIESKKAPIEAQAAVRRWGILIALAFRVVLLFSVMGLIERFSEPFFTVHLGGVVEGAFNFSTIVFLFGGAFIMYTAVKEISHMLAVEHLESSAQRSFKSAPEVVAMIVLMNLIFSFDSILSALAISKVFVVLAIAILTASALMLLLVERVSDFLERNRKYEVLGMFILLIVGVVLLGEGGHEAHLTLFGYAVEPMSKATFYFSIAVLVVVDLIQSRYQRKLALVRQGEQAVG